ncbi:MAG: translation initiation factor [Chthoniobacterales bacterium]
MGKRKPRISTESKDALSVSPFANLSLEDLPPGPPENPKVAPPTRNTKNLGRLILRREKSGRGGKVVTVVDEFPESLSRDELLDYLKYAQRFCGCGGTLRERSIELQGEQIETARNFFTQKGFRVVGS